MSKNRNTVYTCAASREVQYSFTCEKCGRDSGPLSGTFRGKASRSLSYRNRLTDEQLKSLCESARQKLSEEIETTQSLNYYLFDDKCQDCGSTQSWGELKRKINGLSHLYVFFFVTGMIVSIFLLKWSDRAYLTNIPGFFQAVIVIVGICVVFYWPVLVISPIKQKIIKQYKFSSKPTIYWDTIKDTQFSITIADTDSWGAVKKYTINAPEEGKGVQECESTEV